MPLTNIKVLLLNVNRSGWHSGNMIYDMEAICRACDTKLYGPGFQDFKHTDLKKIIEQIYGNDKPDIIYSYFTPDEMVRKVYMDHYNIPSSMRLFPTNFQSVKGIVKIFALSDFWARSPSQYSKDLYESTFEYCFCCFAPPYSNPKHFFAFFDDNIRKKIKFIGYPRCVDKNCFKDYNQPREYDVITTGAMHSFYPLRVYMHNYLKSNHGSLFIKYHNYPHCGCDFSHTDFVRENYAKAINSSKILLSCGGKYHLVMNKIFEAMGCNTAYVGEKPYGHEQLHLEDGNNYIAVDNNNFIEKITYYLKEEEKLNKIIKNGKETFEKYHHIDARSADFVKLVKEIL